MLVATLAGRQQPVSPSRACPSVDPGLGRVAWPPGEILVFEDSADSRYGPLRSTGLCTSMRFVPTISRFFGIVIAMYFDDHGPPHFHARHTEGSAKIRIDTLEAIETSLGRRQLRLVLAWAELHRDELLENWRLARAGETLHEIDPLR